MGIPRSTYYDAPTPADDTEIVAAIVAICDEFEAYGYRRVGAELRQRHHREPQEDPPADARARPAAEAATALRRHDGQRPRRADLPQPGGGHGRDGPNQLWVADITYVAITTGFVYVAVILDAWSRRVVGYAISRSIDARLTVAALQAAIAARNPPPGCVHHSDRGSQYAAAIYRSS